MQYIVCLCGPGMGLIVTGIAYNEGAYKTPPLLLMILYLSAHNKYYKKVVFKNMRIFYKKANLILDKFL